MTLTSMLKAFLAWFRPASWKYERLTREMTFHGVTLGPGWVMARYVNGEKQYREMSADEAAELYTILPW
jgi:hypothetical protein